MENVLSSYTYENQPAAAVTNADVLMSALKLSTLEKSLKQAEGAIQMLRKSPNNGPLVASLEEQVKLSSENHKRINAETEILWTAEKQKLLNKLDEKMKWATEAKRQELQSASDKLSRQKVDTIWNDFLKTQVRSQKPVEKLFGSESLKPAVFEDNNGPIEINPLKRLFGIEWLEKRKKKIKELEDLIE